MSYDPFPSGDPAPYPTDAAPPPRPRLRPPIGIPTPRVSRVRSALASLALHALVIVLLVVPFAAPAVLREIAGAGGATPAGGGGGGIQGSGGDLGRPIVERLRYVHLVAPTPPPTVKPAVPPPVKPPVPPVVPPPPKPATPTPPVTTPAHAAAEAPAPTTGAGGGTGRDGSTGSGPGAGGGIGAGVGTGQGSATGPGTGGGTNTVYPPNPVETFLPPMPVPGRVRGAHVVAVFDVDSTGRVLSVDFTPTSDGGYNRKLKEVLGGYRFRPGTRGDGTPVRAKTSVELIL